jgi:hypothetical protein
LPGAARGHRACSARKSHRCGRAHGPELAHDPCLARQSPPSVPSRAAF